MTRRGTRRKRMAKRVPGSWRGLMVHRAVLDVWSPVAAGHGADGGGEAGLGVDEELGTRDDLLAAREAVEDLDVAARLFAGHDGLGAEPAAAERHDHDRLVARAEDGLARHRQARFTRRVEEGDRR